MATQAEVPVQLPLSITISPWSGFVHRIKKSIREFKYSSVVLVFTHILFWVNAGIIGMTGWILTRHMQLIEKGVGVLFIPGERSAIPTFTEFAVQNLTLLPMLWYVMIAVFILSIFVSVLIYSFGRYGITTFLLLIVTVTLSLIAKIILTPILLLGGF